MVDLQHPLHGTAVECNGGGYLLIGPSGSGKSDLALRLIHQGASLIADDYVDIQQGQEALYLQPPSSLQGILEVRGLGLIRLPFKENIQLKAVIQLQSQESFMRFPERAHFDKLLPYVVPLYGIDPFLPSAVARFWLITQLENGHYSRLSETFLPKLQQV
jgi:serine kinase of HPr protein (carbohydrate metabolism regulator)